MSSVFLIEPNVILVFDYIINGRFNGKQLILDLQKENEELKQTIEDLKKWNNWYKMWHNKYQKQIEELNNIKN